MSEIPQRKFNVELTCCIYWLDHDPTDYRAVMDSAAMFLERRALRWDLGLLYPGLVLRVGPTLSGSGMVEFVMDHRKRVDDRSLSTSKILNLL